MEEVAFDEMKSKAGPMRKRTITPDHTVSTHTQRHSSTWGAKRNICNLGQLGHWGSWGSVLEVSLTCLKCTRRQEDWPHRDKQVRTGNREPRQEAETVEMTGKYRNNSTCSEGGGRVGNTF